MKLTAKISVDAKYVLVDVPVLYGDEDMPYDAPLRTGDRWKALIDIDEGKVKDWPQGKTLSFCMKVCDNGTYIIYDSNMLELAKIEQDYVPNALLPGNYGDYLELQIGESGKIGNWYRNASLADFEKE